MLFSTLINVDLGYATIVRMCASGKHSETLDIIDMNKGTVIASEDRNIYHEETSWDETYLLNYSKEKDKTEDTFFKTYHLVNKEAHYMKMMIDLGWEGNYDSSIIQEVIAQLRTKWNIIIHLCLHVLTLSTIYTLRPCRLRRLTPFTAPRPL